MEAKLTAWQTAVAHVQRAASGPPLSPVLEVSVNFHPDRLVGDLLLLEHLVKDGFYRSQFETGTSNGGLSAHQGGDRWQWESRMFAGAYDKASPRERPIYGALNYRSRPSGGAVRFGSSHLRLTRAILPRLTFCYPDSNASPTDFGTASHMSLVPLAEAGAADVLDEYIEAQVHYGAALPLDSRHVAALVLDPSYRGTPVETAAAQLPFPTTWHHGFRLGVDVLAAHPEFRGPEVVELGRSIAEDGWLDARIIGDAARSGRWDPQGLKRVWHYTARFGRPAEGS